MSSKQAGANVASSVARRRSTDEQRCSGRKERPGRSMQRRGEDKKGGKGSRKGEAEDSGQFKRQDARFFSSGSGGKPAHSDKKQRPSTTRVALASLGSGKASRDEKGEKAREKAGKTAFDRTWRHNARQRAAQRAVHCLTHRRALCREMESRGRKKEKKRTRERKEEKKKKKKACVLFSTALSPSLSLSLFASVFSRAAFPPRAALSTATVAPCAAHRRASARLGRHWRDTFSRVLSAAISLALLSPYALSLSADSALRRQRLPAAASPLREAPASSPQPSAIATGILRSLDSLPLLSFILFFSPSLLSLSV